MGEGGVKRLLAQYANKRNWHRGYSHSVYDTKVALLGKSGVKPVVAVLAVLRVVQTI